MILRSKWQFLGVMLGLLMQVEPANGAIIDVVVPNALANAEGNSFDSLPFEGSLRPYRRQQVYDASQFSAIRDGGGVISEILLRLNGRCQGPEIATISNLQVNLSTTHKGPDTLSTNFAENTGPDDTIVVGPGPFYRFINCSGTINGPRDFQPVLIFHTSFYYNPNVGNLLVDIRNYSGTPADAPNLNFDAHEQTNDTISSLQYFLDVDYPPGHRAPTRGYPTQFKIWFEPKPRLHAAVTETNLVIEWVNYPGGWTLQENSILGSSDTWQAAGGVVTTNGTNKVVTLPLDRQASARFFRVAQSPAAAGSGGAPTNYEPAIILNEDH